MRFSFRYLRSGGLGVLLVLLLASAASAAGIGFKNGHRIPIIVQGATVENAVLRRGQPLLIAPGKMAWDVNLKAGPRIITVYDANQPTRVLYTGPVPFAGRDLLFTVSPMPRNPLRVLLVPLPPP
jgi:hypothetical protein